MSHSQPSESNSTKSLSSQKTWKYVSVLRALLFHHMRLNLASMSKSSGRREVLTATHRGTGIDTAW